MRWLFGLCLAGLALILGACGGGGGPAGVSATVPSAREFQLQVAQLAVSRTPGTSPIKVTGTLNNVTVSGSGTATVAPVQAVMFEGRVALQKTSSLAMTLRVDGTTVSRVQSTSSYFDSNYQPLGQSGSDYQVVEDLRAIPATARVNEGGIAYVANRYTSSGKAVLLGTVESSWILLPDSETTAVLKLTDSAKDPDGVLVAQTVATFRVTPFGSVTRISENTLDIATHTNLTVAY